MTGRKRAVALAAVLVSLASCRAPGDAASATKRYDDALAPLMVPLLTEAIRFPTVKGNLEAREAQKRWLLETARRLDFQARDAGKIVEIEQPGPHGAPVLGLVVHGDVQPADPARWSVPPFDGAAKDGAVYGRGACDDKGPLVQALLAMRALADAGPARTHTIRLLVGSDEESDNTDIKEYLASHAPPDLTLVLDYAFPAVVGEMAWTGLFLDAPPGPRRDIGLPYGVTGLRAGISGSIVPDRAVLTVGWRRGGVPNWAPLEARLAARVLPEGTRLETAPAEDDPSQLVVTAIGKSAHGGTNLENGRNALVALARALEGLLPPSGEDDLLSFARVAGRDLHGGGLGLVEDDPIWGRYLVNVATIEPKDGKLRMTIVLRRPPPRTGAQMKAYLTAKVREFERATGARLAVDGYWDDEPYRVDPEAKIVKRLMACYARATGSAAKPAICGGATYAKRIPNAIAFGMWFPGKPYTGHDVDESIPIDDLHRGTRVLIAALADLACGPKIDRPLEP